MHPRTIERMNPAVGTGTRPPGAERARNKTAHPSGQARGDRRHSDAQRQRRGGPVAGTVQVLLGLSPSPIHAWRAARTDAQAQRHAQAMAVRSSGRERGSARPVPRVASRRVALRPSAPSNPSVRRARARPLGVAAACPPALTAGRPACLPRSARRRPITVTPPRGVPARLRGPVARMRTAAQGVAYRCRASHGEEDDGRITEHEPSRAGAAEQPCCRDRWSEGAGGREEAPGWRGGLPANASPSRGR